MHTIDYSHRLIVKFLSVFFNPSLTDSNLASVLAHRVNLTHIFRKKMKSTFETFETFKKDSISVKKSENYFNSRKKRNFRMRLFEYFCQ